MKNPSSLDLLEHLENKISQGDYIDSVHKIKLMTTVEIIQKILDAEF
tara:strand:+ start:113 stop:253 length:141 start_codon:yes stop_codon:yes gene_type:complete